MGFIAPLFFVYVGLSFFINRYDLLYYLPLFVGLYAASKYLGGFLDARAMKIEPAGAKVVATGIANPGAMEIIIANIGVGAGFISIEQFSLIVLMVVIMMLCIPLLLKRAFERAEEEFEEVEVIIVDENGEPVVEWTDAEKES